MSSSAAEILLAVQLDQAGIPYEREFRFAPPRRWRADFCVHRTWEWNVLDDGLLVEVEGGSFTGGHKRFGAYESDCEKNNVAQLMGYRVLRFTPAMVDDGRALAVIRQALGLAEVAA